MICKQGEYRTENNSCDQCPIGTYQPDGSDETCYWCPLGQTTLQPGSMSVQDCVTGAVDECSTSLHDCSGHSVCVDRPEGYSCECEIGYSKVESKCIGEYKPQGYKKSCSTQLGMKFIMLINVKMPTIVGILIFISNNDFFKSGK